MITMSFLTKLIQLMEEYDIKKIALAIVGVFVLVLGGLYLIYRVKDTTNTQDTIPQSSLTQTSQESIMAESGESEDTETIEEDPFPYTKYKETGVDTGEINFNPTNTELIQGFHIVGEYNPEYAALDSFKGYYGDYDNRLEMGGIDSDSPIVYVDSVGEVHEIEGSTLQDLRNAQVKYGSE